MDMLTKLYPEPHITPTMTTELIMFAHGQRSVVRQLQALQDRQK